MAFRTKLDYSDNRQIKQRERTETTLSGTTVFGVPFSALTSGPDLTTATQTSQYFGVISTYSGNSATTVFTWGIPGVSAVDSSISALTPSNSGVSQDISAVFGSSSTTVIDGNLVNLTYSGVSAGNLYVITMDEPTLGNYTGTVSTDFYIYSADTLDFTGRTIWVDNTEILRTKKLIVTNNPQIGYVLTCADSEGMVSWGPVSGATSGTTYWSASTGTNAIVTINSSNLASGIYALAEGFNTTASGLYSHAEGGNTTASGNVSHAEGNGTIASGVNSHSEGRLTRAFGDYSHAEGFSTTASGTASHTEGRQTTAIGLYSHAEGFSTIASGNSSHSEGSSTVASGDSAHAEGTLTKALGEYSHAEGESTTASGQGSHTEGYLTTASGLRSHAEGSLTIASSLHSHAEGNSTIASGQNSHAEGVGTISSSNASHAEGSGTTASNIASHAEGRLTIAIGNASHAEGYATSAIGITSHAEGYLTTASGQISHTEGQQTIASGYAAHAEGEGTKAIGNASHSEGAYTTASGNSSHAEGQQTTASGQFSHAEGRYTIASGGWSHSGGLSTTASGDYSFVHGSNSVALSANTVVFGNNITGSIANTVYVPDLIIDGLTNTDPIATDANGKIVAGVSDIRLKKNIVTLPTALDVIKNLRGVSFEYTEESNMGPGIRFGFIAQEVQEIVPDLVRSRAKSDGMLNLNYSEIIPWIVEAIKEMTTPEGLILESQTIVAEDNNIELNYNGTTTTAIGGGISLINGISNGVNAEFKLNSKGSWITNNPIAPMSLIIPKYSPSSSSDNYGEIGDITRDDNYLYVKGSYGWKRSSLESF